MIRRCKHTPRHTPAVSHRLAISTTRLSLLPNHHPKGLSELIKREKDPFTINDFLQAHINKLRYDRFTSAVGQAFRRQSSGHDSFASAKEEVAASLKSWYRQTHGVNSSANAEDMSAILEAYWHLAAKRFVDNACMLLDERVMGKLVNNPTPHTPPSHTPPPSPFPGYVPCYMPHNIHMGHVS